jgi:general secretion pathway protein A
MYENYYNLKAMPFQITTDPRFLWLGEKHSEALATLKYGIMENKGFLLLTGDVGTGKTALINRLVKIIDVATIVAKIPDPGLSSLDFFNFLAVEFKMKQKFDSKGQFLINLKRFLHKAYVHHKKVLLIVDEAQRLSHDLLEQIRLLSNIELDNRKLINIFFVGQPEFSELLMEDRNRAVRQRITVSYHIEPLSETETRKYIKHRLKVAGVTREIFSKDAVRQIYSFSAGYPRLINVICDHAMLTGYTAGLKSIDKKVIKECEQELQIPIELATDNGDDREKTISVPNKSTDRRPEKSSALERIGLIVAIIMLLTFGVYFFTSQKFADESRWTIEEIAPQEHKGPSPEEMKVENGDSGPENELNEPEPINESAVGNQSLSNQIQAAENDDAISYSTQEPFDKSTAGNIGQQPTASEKIQKELAAGENQTTPLLLERKFIIYFNYNSNALTDQSFETLNRIAGFMLNNPTSTIDVKGYTDSTGNYNYNISVSEFRANTIKTYLVGKGIEPARIKAVGEGPENPIATNKTEEGRRKNRRVEIELNAQS